MKTFKKISYLVFLFCVMQWPTWKVESASTAAASSKGSSFAKTDDKGQEVSSSVLGSLYRKSRQSRCVTCYEDRRYAGSEDRSRYSGSYAGRSGDDRSSSWYYPSYDRYEERGYRGVAGAEYDRYAVAGADRYGADRYGAGGDRYGADRYGADRYGAGADRYGAGADRYGAGADRYGAGGDRYGSGGDRYGGYRDDRYGARPAYDRYDTRTRGAYERPAAYDRGESRGYGYEKRDRYGGEQRDRYYERPRYGAAAAGTGASAYGYDRDNYDRYSPRGQSGFDSSGRGYYFAKGGSQEDRHYLPEAGYNSPAISPCGPQKPNCPYAPQDGGTRVSSAPIDSGYKQGVSQTTYNTNLNSNRNDSSKGSGSGWSYMREDEEPSRSGHSSGSNSSSSSNNSNSRDRNRDQQSPAYGALLDRGSNLIAVEPAKASDSGANDSMTNNDKQQSSDVNNEKPSDNGQNS